MATLPDPLKHRTADHPIEQIFLKRWSPRSLRPDGVGAADLNRLFEAARWAPSSYNEQEWRFLYAIKGSKHWDTFLNLLVPANQTWCKDAGALVVVISKTTFTHNGKPNVVHSFDAGLASMNLMLQATAMGLVTHGMGGFDRDKTRSELQIPADFQPEAMIAIGKPGDPDTLPAEVRKGEVPSGRKKVSEIAREGTFSF